MRTFEPDAGTEPGAPGPWVLPSEYYTRWGEPAPGTVFQVLEDGRVVQIGVAELPYGLVMPGDAPRAALYSLRLVPDPRWLTLMRGATAPDPELPATCPPPVAPGIKPTLNRLAEILSDAEEYDDDFLPPAPSVVEYTRELLHDTAEKRAYQWPLYHVAPLGGGGLSIQWGQAGRYVALYVPAPPGRASVVTIGMDRPTPSHAVASPESLGFFLTWLGQNSEA